jgi:hypothetical protein
LALAAIALVPASASDATTAAVVISVLMVHSSVWP